MAASKSQKIQDNFARKTMEDIKKKDEAYMRRALMEAQAAFDEDEIPVGAIIVCIIICNNKYFFAK